MLKCVIYAGPLFIFAILGYANTATLKSCPMIAPSEACMIVVERGSQAEFKPGEGGIGRLIVAHTWNDQPMCIHAQNVGAVSPEAPVLDKTGHVWRPVTCREIISVPHARHGVNAIVTFEQETQSTSVLRTVLGLKQTHTSTYQVQESADEIRAAFAEAGLAYRPKLKPYGRFQAWKDRRRHESPYL